MALIKCPECKKKISDYSESCPRCGYPIKRTLVNNEAAIITTVITDDMKGDAKKTSLKPKNFISKRICLWLIIGAIIVAIAVIFIFNSKVKPKVDENGTPIFVELTDEVYTNADEYLGYYVKVTGKVFQKIGDNGEVKGVQVWLDPNNSDLNLMINYTTDVSLKEGDYVVCTGYIKKIQKYDNAFGAELAVPLIHSNDLQKTTYLYAMSPTISTILPKKTTYEKLGYSISVDKIEFAANETRVYLNVANNGKTTLHVNTDSSVIIHNKKQINTKTNYDANYDAIPSSLHKGTKACGVITFPAIKDDAFEIVIEMYSDDYDEEFMPIVFKIGQTEKKEYESAIIEALAVMNDTSTNVRVLFPDALWKWLDGHWQQSSSLIEQKVCEKLLLEDEPHNRAIPYAIHVETKLSSREKNEMLNDYKSKYVGIGIDSIEDAYCIELEVMLSSGYFSQYLNITLAKIDGNWYWMDLLHFE